MMKFNMCARRAAPAADSRRRGQVLPLGLVFLVICCAALLFMFSAGKVVDEKLTVTNAADAAAYSAGIAHARSLNYEAYVNRAIIANELAIAQAVSMVSWVRYFEQGVYNVATLDELVVQHLIAGGVPIAAVLSGTAYLDAWTGGTALQEIVEIIEYINALGIINIHAGRDHRAPRVAAGHRSCIFERCAADGPGAGSGAAAPIRRSTWNLFRLRLLGSPDLRSTYGRIQRRWRCTWAPGGHGDAFARRVHCLARLHAQRSEHSFRPTQRVTAQAGRNRPDQLR